MEIKYLNKKLNKKYKKKKKPSFSFNENNIILNHTKLERFEKSFIIDKNLNFSFPKKKLYLNNEKNKIKYESILKNNKFETKFLYKINNLNLKIDNQINNLLNKFQFKNLNKLYMKENKFENNENLKFNINKENIKSKFDEIQQLITYFQNKLKNFNLEDISKENNQYFIKLIDNIFSSYINLENMKDKNKTNFIYDIFFIFYTFNINNFNSISEKIKNLKYSLKNKFNLEKNKLIGNLEKIIKENIKLKRSQKSFDNFPKKLKNLLNMLDTQFFNMDTKITNLRRNNTNYINIIKNYNELFEDLNYGLLDLKNVINCKNNTINQINNNIDELLIDIDNNYLKNKNISINYDLIENYKKEYDRKLFEFNNIFKDNYTLNQQNISTQYNYKPLTLNAYTDASKMMINKNTQVNFIKYYFYNLNNKIKTYNLDRKIEKSEVSLSLSSSLSIKYLEFNKNKNVKFKKNPKKVKTAVNFEIKKNKTCNNYYNTKLNNNTKNNSKNLNIVEKFIYNKSYLNYIKNYFLNISLKESFNINQIINNLFNSKNNNYDLITSNFNYNIQLDFNYFKDISYIAFKRYQVKYLNLCKQIIESNNKDLLISFYLYFKNRYTNIKLVNKNFFKFIFFLKEKRNEFKFKLIFLLLEKDNLNTNLIFFKIFESVKEILKKNNLNTFNFHSVNLKIKINLILKIINNIKNFLNKEIFSKFNSKIIIDSLIVDNYFDYKKFNLDQFLINLINELKINIYFKCYHIFKSYDIEFKDVINFKLFNHILYMINLKEEIKEDMTLQFFFDYFNKNEFFYLKKLYNILQNNNLKKQYFIYDYYLLKVIFLDRLYKTFKIIIIEEIKDNYLTNIIEIIKNSLYSKDTEFKTNNIWCLFKIIEIRINNDKII